MQNDIITIEWSPPEKDEYFDAEFQRSLRLLTDGKLEDARFILEDLAFRSPDEPNVLYYLSGLSIFVTMVDTKLNRDKRTRG